MNKIITSENIHSIILAGESNTIEFKTSVKSSIVSLPKIISAFANTDGGVVILGYDERKHSVIGTSSRDLEIVKSFILKNKFENICNTYTVLYEKKTLIIIQVKKAKSIVFTTSGVYERRGACIAALTGEDIVKRLMSSVENSTLSSDEKLDKLTQLIQQISDDLSRSQIEHEEELKVSKRNNWFFCILSAVLGYVLGIIF